MFRYVLFDFDGTVYDTVEGIAKSAQYAAAKQGYDRPLEAFRCFAGPPLLDMFMEQFGMSREEAFRAIDDFRARYLPVGVYESRIFPGIPELIAELRRLGCVLGVATSKPQTLAEKLMRDVDVYELFDYVAGSSLDGNDDAKWQVTKRAMDALHAVPEETVLVGDTKYDVLGAHTCGIKCIGVRYGYAAPGELEAAGADYMADTVEDIKKIVMEERA